jgi:diphthine synthase
MLYLVGLGLNKKGISGEGKESLERCKKIYIENYTVDFPYSIPELEEALGCKIEPVGREFVEGLTFIDEAKKKNVALLIYGNPLLATTHITILNECKNSKIQVKVIHSSSVFDGVLESGLQFYKFGKVASLPDWEDKGESESFMEIVKDNYKIGAHTLLLVDIGLNIQNAIKQLEKASKNSGITLGKIVLCQAVGTKNSRIFYKDFEELKYFDSVRKPYCFVLPGKLHFLEKEFLENFQ